MADARNPIAEKGIAEGKDSAPASHRAKATRRKFPARLHVLLAREADVGLVIRRGPSKSVCTVKWDRKRDSFETGQWMRGRIYERRSDLSPDGQHWIYFAMNGRWESTTRGAWTAIAKVPFLKAVSLFAKGDCWHGGGLFKSNREYWLNDGSGHTELTASILFRRGENRGPSDNFGGECPNVYYNRLRRDGWVMDEEEVPGATLFVKKLANEWSLRKHAFAETGPPPGRGCYWDAHELICERTGEHLAFPEWEWADFVDDRLVWAADGRLCAARLGPKGLEGQETLHDFNDMGFQAIAAPY